MIKELFYKWFDIQPFVCPTCEVLQLQLEESQRQNKYLLEKLLTPKVDGPTGVQQEPVDPKDMEPVGPRYIPWRVRQAHFEQEDRAKAEILRKNKEDVEAAKKRLAEAKPGSAEQQASIVRLEKEL